MIANPIFVVTIVVIAILLGIVVALYLHPSRRALGESRQREEELRGECARRAEQEDRLRGEVAQLMTERARLGERVENLEPLVARNDKLQGELATLGAENARLREQLRQESEQRAAMRRDSEQAFRELAGTILEEKSNAFRENNERRLGEILTPFKENVEGLQRIIRECYTGEVSEVKSLRDSLKELTELNNTISREARELTDALKGNSKVQGDWGEMVLQQILERSGLEEGVNFTIQATTNADGTKIKGEENNQLRPDVIFHLPEGKHIVIDSKVSLKAYVNYVSATTDDERQAALCQHLASVVGHVKELTGKKYQTYVKDAADFVMMFIPNEGAYMAALNADPDLWDKAYQQHVVIISPTHLISVLKLMYQLWTRDKQTKNALLIAEKTGDLYDKLCGFVQDLEGVGKALASAEKSYLAAQNKLSSGTGNILKRVEDIKALGVKTTKQLRLTGEE